MSAQDPYVGSGLGAVGDPAMSVDVADRVAAERLSADRAPGWLVGLVLVLFLAVLVVGVMVVSRVLARDSNANVETARVRVFEEAVRARPDDISVRRQLAFAYQQAGREGDAMREYDRVLSKEPRDLAALYNKGLICLGTGRQAEGERTLQEVLQLAPSHSLAAKALGEYYVGSKQFDRLVEIAVPAADAHRDLADLQYLAGLGYEKTGRVDEAESRYRLALTLVPDMREAQDGLERLRQTE